jgi:hydrogenase expression/formation protein HypC
MCLGIPGQVIEIVDPDNYIAKVDVNGVRRNVNVGLLPADGIDVGDWVLIHVGFALSRIDAEEAAATFRFLEDLGQAYADELDQLTQSQIE